MVDCIIFSLIICCHLILCSSWRWDTTYHRRAEPGRAEQSLASLQPSRNGRVNIHYCNPLRYWGYLLCSKKIWHSKYLRLWKFTCLAVHTHVSTSLVWLCLVFLLYIHMYPQATCGCSVCVPSLHRWLHSRCIFLYLAFYAQDLFRIVLHVVVYWSRLFALTTVREMFLNHRCGAATSLPRRADSWRSHRSTGSSWT